MALLLVGALGFMAGAAVAEVAALIGRHRRRMAKAALPLTDQDRMDLTAEFATHTTAVWSQVRSFADALADGDTELRERLRRFEGGR